MSEREAFEAWCQVGDASPLYPQLKRDELGYTNSVIAACWEAWQARALAAPTAPTEPELNDLWTRAVDRATPTAGNAHIWFAREVLRRGGAQ